MPGANSVQQSFEKVNENGIHWTINFTGVGGTPETPDSPPTFKIYKDGVLYSTDPATESLTAYAITKTGLAAGTYKGETVYMLNGIEFVAPTATLTLIGATAAPFSLSNIPWLVVIGAVGLLVGVAVIVTRKDMRLF